MANSLVGVQGVVGVRGVVAAGQIPNIQPDHLTDIRVNTKIYSKNMTHRQFQKARFMNVF
jgi:hypothetical protein